MADAAQNLKVLYAEYLAAESVAEVKHEFIDGEIYAMSGGSWSMQPSSPTSS